MDQVIAFERHAPQIKIRTIFDVGANVGKVTSTLRQAYPIAVIHSFEPVSATFAALTATVSGDERTICHNFALGDRAETATILAVETAETNKIITKRDSRPTQTITVERGDEFCRRHGIASIDFLKIDAEGYDLKVCQGFGDMLRERRIALIQVEAGVDPENKLHIPLVTFMQFFEPFGYAILGFFNQDIGRRRPALPRCNVVFVANQHYANAETEHLLSGL